MKIEWLIDYCQTNYGMQEDDTFDLVGLNNTEDRPIDLFQINSAIGSLSRYHRDPCLAAKLSQNMTISDLFGFDFSSPGYYCTIEEIAKSYVKFQAWMSEHISMRYVCDKRHGVFCYDMLLPEKVTGTHLVAQHAIAMVIAHVQTLSGYSTKPVKIFFNTKKPTKTDELENFFGCPVVFRKSTNAIVFRRDELLQTSVLSGAPKSFQGRSNFEREREIEHKLDYLDDSAVRLRSIDNLVWNKPTINAHEVARSINISERSLARFLETKKTSFRIQKTWVLARKALYLLSEKNYSVTQTALELGYSDHSSFTRSFKKNNGITPHYYVQSNPNRLA